MTDPYRSTTSTKCVRCKQGLLADGDDLVCGDGCGTWIANAQLARLLPVDEVKPGARANPFRANPFPPARCPFCKNQLDDCYAGSKVVVSLGQCLEHGIWLDRATRADFQAAYDGYIRKLTHAREAALAAERKKEREQQRATEDVAHWLDGNDTVNRTELARRIAELERIVATLTRQS